MKTTYYTWKDLNESSLVNYFKVTGNVFYGWYNRKWNILPYGSEPLQNYIRGKELIEVSEDFVKEELFLNCL